MPRLTPQQILSADSTMYIGNFEFYNTLSSNGKYYFPNGFVSLLDGNHLKYNFMATDHLGNTRAVTSIDYNGVHRIEQKNSYYAYGGIMDDVAESADVQTHKYNGKELDRMHGLDWYDYHARQYDATIGQFTSMDPLCEKYYHISPYVYCAGNPVKYVDPDGRELVLKGTEEERKKIFDLIQSLTNNVLVMNKSGVVSIGKGKANTDKNLSNGTGLIADIIKNSHTMTVSVGGKNNESSYPNEKDPNQYANNDGTARKGTDVIVTIDLKDRQQPKYLSGNNQNRQGIVEGRPLFIGVAHELVHGIRGMEGSGAYPDMFDSYYYNDGILRSTQDCAEELRTIGITGRYKYTENKIRREHGLKERRMYNPKK